MSPHVPRMSTAASPEPLPEPPGPRCPPQEDPAFLRARSGAGDLRQDFNLMEQKKRVTMILQSPVSPRPHACLVSLTPLLSPVPSHLSPTPSHLSSNPVLCVPNLFLYVPQPSPPGPNPIPRVANASPLVPGPILCCTRPIPPFPKLIDVTTWWCMPPPGNVAVTELPVLPLCQQASCVADTKNAMPPSPLWHQTGNTTATKLVMLHHQ